QVHGGIVQGIGQALLEHAVYDPDSGQLLSGSFMDYVMPRAGDVPPFAFSTHNVPSTANPLGVKGAGEAGAVGAPPAVINAIVDALDRRVGMRHIDMPATPRRVWEMLNGIHYGHAARPYQHQIHHTSAGRSRPQHHKRSSIARGQVTLHLRNRALNHSSTLTVHPAQ